MFIILVLLFLCSPMAAMQWPLDGHLISWVDKKEYDTTLAKLDTTVDAHIIKHLMLNDNYWDTTQNLKHFFSVNKSLRALAGNIHLTAFLVTLLVQQKEAPFMAAALQLATPGAHTLVRFIKNQTDPQNYCDAIKFAAKSPRAQNALRGLIACDTQGLAFKGIPRITPLMIAVGYKNEVGVDILLAAAKKRNILNEYLNMQCPKGTCTYDESIGADK